MYLVWIHFVQVCSMQSLGLVEKPRRPCTRTMPSHVKKYITIHNFGASANYSLLDLRMLQNFADHVDLHF